MATIADQNPTSQAELAPCCTLTLNLWGGSTVGGREQALWAQQDGWISSTRGSKGTVQAFLKISYPFMLWGKSRKAHHQKVGLQKDTNKVRSLGVWLALRVRHRNFSNLVLKSNVQESFKTKTNDDSSSPNMYTLLKVLLGSHQPSASKQGS